VRWLAYDTGSGNVPAVNTSITQGGVTGILLGVWDSLTSEPTAVGAAMPADGFIKFLSVSGGAFAAGALTGIGANATAADVAGWIEIVADSVSTITVARLGEHEIRGDWFYLEDTNGSIAQQLQVPTNGGGALTYCPGVWVETGVGTGIYEYYPSAAVAADGWSISHLGGAFGETDRRQNFVKDAGSGLLQFGENVDLVATYANIAAQASTYATLAHSSTYAVVGNVCTVTYATGHLLKTGATVGIDFTSGGAAALDGSFVITVIDAYAYTFELTTADTSGNCTVRPGVTVTFAAHSLGSGDTVYCDATTGTLPDGDYTIYAVTGTGAYLIAYPHTVALTSGNVSVYSRYEITYTAHGLAVGNRVYLDFTSGAGVDGIYTIVEVPTTATFRVVMNNNGADSGNVTVKMTIGNAPVSGCKTRIPNVFLREAATATRASNMVNATAASRPEWSTAAAGAIDMEKAYSSWYHNFAQPYSIKHLDTCTYSGIVISECATAVDVNNTHISNSGSGTTAIAPLTLTSNFAGGTVQNSSFIRGGLPASSGHAVAISYCIGTILDNVTAGIIQYARSSGYGISVAYGSDITVKNCHTINGAIGTTALVIGEITDNDHTDRYVGYTNATTARYGVTIGAGSVDIMVDGLTFGYNGTIANNHPYSGLVTSSAGTTVCFRNMGTFDVPLPCGSWRPSLYAMGYCFGSGGNNYGLRCQRLFADNNMRTSPLATTNSDKNVSHEQIYGGMYTMSAMTPYLLLDTGLNSVIKGCKTGANTTAGQSSIYGTHFFDMFISDLKGRYVLCANEPTADTTQYFTMVAGVQKFNSVGGILMGTVGDQAIWEDQYYRKGHTGFQNSTPTMSGGTIGQYTLEYDIDINDGNGFTGSWTAMTGANLSGETISPTDGFKLKIRITTITANLTAITYLRIDTTTTAVAQENNYYDLDQYILTITGLETGTKVAFLATGTETLLDNIIASTGSTASYVFPDSDIGNTVDVAVLKAGFVYQKISYTLTAASVSIPVVMEADIVYMTADSDAAFDGATHRIVADAGVTTLVVQSGVYSAWVDWAMLTDNLKYEQAIRAVGGDTISATKDLGITYFLLNDWRIRPDEADYRLIIEGNIYTDPSGSSVVVSTLTAHSVVVEMQVSNLSDANLAQMPEIEYASFNEVVTIDVDNGTAGTAYPIGTHASPVNNLANAKTIAATRGFTTLKLISDLTITTGQDISGYRIESDVWSIVTIETGVDTTDTEFSKIDLYGELSGTWNVLIDCYAEDVTNFLGWMRGGSVVNVELAPYVDPDPYTLGSSYFDNIVPMYANISSVLVMNDDVSVSFTNCTDMCEIKGMTAGSVINAGLLGGKLIINADCTGGDVIAVGVGIIENNSAIVVNTDGLVNPDSIATANWSATASENNGLNSMGALLNDAGLYSDPWESELPGTYTGVQAGNIVGSALDQAVSQVGGNVSGELSVMPNAVTATLEEKVTWLFEYFAHQRSVTATGETLLKTDGITPLGASIITKDATTYTKGKME